MPVTPFATLLAVAGLVLAILYGLRFSRADPSPARSALKTSAVLALAGAGLVLGAPALIVAGLALGALGDYFLSRKGTGAFLAGMAAFAAGHLAYAVDFLGPGAPPVVPALALLALAASTEVWLAPRTGDLRWPVRGYVLVITAMALAALTLPDSARPALIGALLFLASDLMLALDLFVVTGERAKRLLGPLLWAAYWAGQALILWGMLPGGRP